MKIWPPPPPLIKKSKFRILDFLMFFADPPPFGLFPLFGTFFNWNASLMDNNFVNVLLPIVIELFSMGIVPLWDGVGLGVWGSSIFKLFFCLQMLVYRLFIVNIISLDLENL